MDTAGLSIIVSIIFGIPGAICAYYAIKDHETRIKEKKEEGKIERERFRKQWDETEKKTNLDNTIDLFFDNIEKVPLSLDVLVHLQDIGDKLFCEGKFAGTRGQSRRLEGFQLSFHPLTNNLCIKDFLSMQYMAHLEDIGDTKWLSEGQFCGTRGKSRRLEGFAIKLTGKYSSKFTVQYMAHLQDIGDTDWFSDGQFCGTRGQSRRLEGLCVKVLKK
jgi:uncharacterized protein YjdB